MTEIAEYEYEERHLTESEALERFTREKSAHPDAIITLDDLRCGHLEVTVYQTDAEKQAFYRKRVSDLIHKVLSVIVK